MDINDIDLLGKVSRITLFIRKNKKKKKKNQHCCRFVLSGMIAQWYFHRKDTINNSVNVLKSSMIRGTTTSFGTIALSGFLMAIVHFSQFVIKQLKKVTTQQTNYVF